MAYEIAFENWRLTRDDKTVSRSATRGSRVVERSVIAAGVSPGRARLGTLVLRLEGADLRGGDLEGARQTLRGDTLRVKRENDAALVPAWSLLTDLQRVHREHRADLADEPLLQAHQLNVLRTAVTIAGTERDPRGIVDRLARWTHDSLAKAAAHGVPDALATLRLRRGDARDHAQLFVAFSRALGIPARLAGGLVLVNGTFYQHAWAEVWLRDWVAVDPTLGQFPADAAHVRLVIGGTARDADLLRLIGNLDIRVLEAR